MPRWPAEYTPPGPPLPSVSRQESDAEAACCNADGQPLLWVFGIAASEAPIVTDGDTSGSGGSRCILTALLPLGCIAGLFVGLRLLLSSPAAPGSVCDLFGREADSLSVAAFSVLLLWMGLAPARVGLAILRKPSLCLGLPVWAGLLGVTFVVMFRLSATGVLWDEPWSQQTGRLLLLFSYSAVILILGSAVVGAATRLAWDSALQCIFLLLLTGLPWIVLAHITLVSWGIGEGAAGLVRSGSVHGHVFLVLLAFLVAVNGAALGHALRRLRARSLLAWLLVTVVLVVPGWLLLRLGLSPEVVESGVKYPAVRLLLAADPHVNLSWSDLFLRWFAVQGGLVLAIALGHLCAMRFVREAPAAQTRMGEVAPPEEPGTSAVSGSRAPTTRPGRAYFILACVYGILVVYGSLVPMNFHSRPFEESLEAFLRVPYLELGIRNRADLVANLLLFIPLTFLVMGAMTRENTRVGRWLPAAVVMTGAVVLSVGIEFLQLYFPPRTVSLNDILAECVGGGVGIGAWLLVGGRVTAWWRRLASLRRPGRLATHLLTGYVVALVLYQLFPFDLVLSVDEMVLKLRQGKLVFMPFADLPRISILVILVKAAVQIPVGYWIVVRWAGARRPVWAALGGGFAFVAALELLQMFIFSRYASSTDIVLGAWGAGMGGLLARHFGPAASRSLPRGILWALLSWSLRLGATAGVAGALIWGKWSPLAFRWPTDGLARALAHTVQVPFFHQYWNSEFEAFSQILRDVVVPAALGILLMAVVARLPRGRRLVAGIVAGSISAAAELGQVFFPPHTPDMTTAVLAAAGGVVGVFLYRPFVETFVRPGYAADSENDGWSST